MPSMTGSLKALARRAGEILQSERSSVGGLWEEVGRLQFEFLVRQGLQPRDRFLDVGCGALRGGVHFIAYLEPGRYFGVEKSNRLLRAGRKELKRNNLLQKNPTLMQNDCFDFVAFRHPFDFALAQSVFTHLPLNSILRCLVNIDKMLKPDGRFYATFFKNPQGRFNLEPVAHPRSDGPDIISFFDQDPYHYDFETLRWACEGTGLRAEYIGHWNHPRNQMMMVYIKEESTEGPA